MSTGYIAYEKLKGYKYRLKEDFFIYLPELLNYSIQTPYIQVKPNGHMMITEEYAWDGASGPTIDTKSSMRGSLVHDALAQLMRMGLLPASFRKVSDAILERINLEDGMWPVRANIWEKILNKFGGFSILPRPKEGRIYYAPKEPST